MASTPEALVKKKIRKILDAEGVYYAMPIGTGYGNSGVPDFLCCVGGRFVAIEAKAGKGKTTALQDEHIARIRDAKGAAIIINEENLYTLEPLIHFIRGRDE
jgi:Holliday junction resolvase